MVCFVKTRAVLRTKVSFLEKNALFWNKIVTVRKSGYIVKDFCVLFYNRERNA